MSSFEYHLSPFPLRNPAHLARGDIKLVISPTVLEEVRECLAQKFPQHLGDFEAFLSMIDYELVSDPTPEEEKANIDLVRDPKDVYIVLAAVKAKVDHLVSAHADLTDVDETTEKLRQLIQPLKIGSFLSEVMGWSSEELERIGKRKWIELKQPFWAK
jgi:predicted nucleic acid-binding protein